MPRLRNRQLLALTWTMRYNETNETQGGVSMEMKDTLKQLREARGLTQEQLAQRVLGDAQAALPRARRVHQHPARRAAAALLPVLRHAAD